MTSPVKTFTVTREQAERARPRECDCSKVRSVPTGCVIKRGQMDPTVFEEDSRCDGRGFIPGELLVPIELDLISEPQQSEYEPELWSATARNVEITSKKTGKTSLVTGMVSLAPPVAPGEVFELIEEYLLQDFGGEFIKTRSMGRVLALTVEPVNLPRPGHAGIDGEPVEVDDWYWRIATAPPEESE